jgi:hypothetical protein
MQLSKTQIAGAVIILFLILLLAAIRTFLYW